MHHARLRTFEEIMHNGVTRESRATIADFGTVDAEEWWEQEPPEDDDEWDLYLETGDSWEAIAVRLEEADTLPSALMISAARTPSETCNAWSADGVSRIVRAVQDCALNGRFMGLRHLALHGGIGDESVEHIAESLSAGALRNLSSLDMSNNTITQTGAACLARALMSTPGYSPGLGGMLCLEELDLSFNALRDDGVALMSEILQCVPLRVLNLGHNWAGPSGAAALIAALAGNATVVQIGFTLERVQRGLEGVGSANAKHALVRGVSDCMEALVDVTRLYDMPAIDPTGFDLEQQKDHFECTGFRRQAVALCLLAHGLVISHVCLQQLLEALRIHYVLAGKRRAMMFHQWALSKLEPSNVTCS